MRLLVLSVVWWVAAIIGLFVMWPIMVVVHAVAYPFAGLWKLCGMYDQHFGGGR
jgi:hypothetical protein